ncbi:cutinase-2 [Coleophoma cylindrospora]|uniref:Cutinase n=1 Tax=Coleophoma cylindrospora TaxID=1849047 RepID=A0A3D8QDP3_9HELO|nr:cutinase-2 [Coleophoma cylindrospora]
MYFHASILALLLAASSSAIPITEATRRQLGSSITESDLTNGVACKAVTVIFARGTTEMGNVGSVAGPPFFAALATDIGAGNLAVQGVPYAADIAGFLEGGDPTGSSSMASLISQAQTQCPSTKIVLSGYSQGGQLVHNAAKTLTTAQNAAVAAVVIFGDPDNGEAVGSIPSSNVLIICHAGDDICAHGDSILAPHLTYGQDASTAASFVAKLVG